MTTPHTGAEIARQPESWRRAGDLVGTAAVADLLPRADERVAVIGCGTSWFVAQAYAAKREAHTGAHTDAFAASEMPTRRYDRLIAISRSGTTTEVLQLLERVRGTMPTTAITCDTTTPIVDLADGVIDLSFADEQSVVQTVSATTALTVLRTSLGEDLSTAADQAEQVIAETVPAELVTAEQFSFLGRGWTVGLAHEAGLKMREAALAWTETYPAMEYRHGPISIAETGRVTWSFGPAPEGLADQVAATGALWVEHTDVDPMVDLIRVHKLAVAIAEHRGMNPDEPRNLTRSIVLQ
ncbi:SIS domain-containing protein [Nakamurella leprariae]|uniref:SIS domain-containing protein n=1 Tax=Nakamurella leprariae TaxID=2803911 RepID=A0A939C0A7_9ACTN|nr:SIS domain-containing protein [Nakamurella leprariae]MBM9469030.1 SIS domain-containing protein [Nakamurella leprariae]